MNLYSVFARSTAQGHLDLGILAPVLADDSFLFALEARGTTLHARRKMKPQKDWWPWICSADIGNQKPVVCRSCSEILSFCLLMCEPLVLKSTEAESHKTCSHSYS